MAVKSKIKFLKTFLLICSSFFINTFSNQSLAQTTKTLTLEASGKSSGFGPAVSLKVAFSANAFVDYDAIQRVSSITLAALDLAVGKQKLNLADVKTTWIRWVRDRGQLVTVVQIRLGTHGDLPSEIYLFRRSTDASRVGSAPWLSSVWNFRIGALEADPNAFGNPISSGRFAEVGGVLKFTKGMRYSDIFEVVAASLTESESSGALRGDLRKVKKRKIVTKASGCVSQASALMS